MSSVCEQFREIKHGLIGVSSLEGLAQQASENQEKAQSIIELYARMRRQVAELTHSQFSDLTVDFIFSRPIFSTSHFVEGSNIPRQTALRIVRLLRDNEGGILKTVREGAGQRAAILAFPELVNIAEGRRVI